jgi:hypothetical protein
LRAAECAQFGMEPVGVIANRFLEGSLDDDAAVALTHMPGELGWGGLSEPLVDVEATLDALRDRALITAGEFTALNASAAAIFFKRRSIEAIVAAADVRPARGEILRTLFALYRRSQKADDALELVAQLRAAELGSPLDPRGWRLAEPPMWREHLSRLRAAAPRPTHVGR